MSKPLTPEQVKENWLEKGITGADWARDNGYTPRQVSTVLNGQIKGRFGKGHEIAVKLGIKKGTLPEPTKTQAA